jgi:AAA domain-containing protein/primase-like protein
MTQQIMKPVRPFVKQKPWLSGDPSRELQKVHRDVQGLKVYPSKLSPPDSEGKRTPLPYSLGIDNRATDKVVKWRENPAPATFDQALGAVRLNSADGIQAVLEPGSFVVLDFDNVLSTPFAPGDQWPDWLVPIVALFKGRAFIEYSKGGRGLHIFIRGIKPTGMGTYLFQSEAGDCECFDKGKLIYLTGKIPEGYECNGPIEDCSVPLDKVWLAFLAESPNLATPGFAPPIPEKIAAGGRSNALVSLAGSMRHRGMDEGAIDAALQITNAERCDPPLSKDEVRRIAESVSKYAPGKQVAEANKTPTIVPPPELKTPSSSSTPIIVRGDTLQLTPIPWLWPGKIPKGRGTIVAGYPGTGKSLLSRALAAIITTGSPWPDGSGTAPCGPVIMCSAEDDPNDTAGPQLIAHRADMEKIVFLTGIKRTKGNKTQEHPLMLTDLPELEYVLQNTPNCQAIFIDPLGSYLPGDTDAYRDNVVRSVVAPVLALGRKYNVAVIFLCHVGKTKRDRADDAILGSVAFPGIARSVMHLVEDGTNPNRRLLLMGKNNLAKKADGLAFTIHDSGPSIVVNWEKEPVKLTADEHSKSSSRNTDESDSDAWKPENFAALLSMHGPMTRQEILALIIQHAEYQPKLNFDTIKKLAQDAMNAGLVGERIALANGKANQRVLYYIEPNSITAASAPAAGLMATSAISPDSMIGGNKKC